MKSQNSSDELKFILGNQRGEALFPSEVGGVKTIPVRTEGEEILPPFTVQGIVGHCDSVVHLLDGNSDVLVRQTMLPMAFPSVKAYEGY